MALRLSGTERQKFISDLLAHREAHSLNDADYAAKILKVALNTYKKCVSNEGDEPLSLKRQTFVNIFSNSGLNPNDYGLNLTIPSKLSRHGGYRKSDYAHMCGQYLLYRRSFFTARHITRALLEIKQSSSQECLEFREEHHYLSEPGEPEHLIYDGEIHINKSGTIISMPSFEDGQVRLTHYQPDHLRTGQVRLRGALLTFGNPKGTWQPTVSAVLAEPYKGTGPAKPMDVCATLEEGTKQHTEFSKKLAYVEEHTTIMTPLMWWRLQQEAGGTRAQR